MLPSNVRNPLENSLQNLPPKQKKTEQANNEGGKNNVTTTNTMNKQNVFKT